MCSVVNMVLFYINRACFRNEEVMCIDEFNLMKELQMYPYGDRNAIRNFPYVLMYLIL